MEGVSHKPMAWKWRPWEKKVEPQINWCKWNNDQWKQMGLTKKISMSQENNNCELLNVDLYVEIDRIKNMEYEDKS